jgi:DNA-binding SARP family transcriptional activator/predicted ATPase
MSNQLLLHLLGKPQSIVEGAPTHRFAYNKSLALLSYLAVTGRAHSRETLAGLLWGDLPEESARSNLRKILAELRQTVPDHVLLTRQTVAFDCSAPHWSDVDAFQLKLQSLRAPAEPAVFNENEVRLLIDAVDLYAGDFMEGFYVRDAPAFEEWVLVQRELLRQAAVQALHLLAKHHTARGQYSAGLAYTSRLLALEPWHEEYHQQMMILYALSGQRSAALRQYELCRQVLNKEMGARPAPATEALYGQIRDGELLASLAPQNPPHNLSAQMTPFVGRAEELRAIDMRLRERGCRLLTLVGISGIGKSRLAQQIAADLLPAFPDGVFAVALSPLVTEQTLPAAIALALGLSLEPPVDSRRQVLDHLRTRDLLLVLDDFQHAPAAADFLLEILRGAPKVKILVAASELLNVPGEWIQPVSGLSFPAGGGQSEDPGRYDAGRLFLASAGRMLDGFAVQATDWRAVARICELVEGVPLAIELAASWVRILSLPDIVEEIENNIDILATTSYSVPERQRSLRAVFEHAWSRLPENDRDTFIRLTVFEEGFVRRAAQEVVSADLPALAALVDRGLMQANSFGRYRIHRFLQRYAAERLAQDAENERLTRDRHCAYFATFLNQRVQLLNGPQCQDAVDQIRGEMENIQAAYVWARRRASSEIPGAGEDAEDFFRICRQLEEGRSAVHRVIAHPDLPETS